MEEELEKFLENEDSEKWSRPTFMLLLDIFLPLVCLIGIIADLIIILTILPTKQLRSRTNIILSHWAFTDMLFLLSTPVVFFVTLYYFHLLKEEENLICILSNIEIVYRLASVLFMTVIAIDKLMKNKSVSINFAISVIYMFSILIWLISTGLCLESHHFHAVYTFMFLAYIFLLLAVGYKQFSMFSRYKPVGSNIDDNIRVSVVSIYVLIWLGSSVCAYISVIENSLAYLIIFGTFGCLNSVFIFFTLCYMNPSFRKGALELFKRENYEEEMTDVNVNSLEVTSCA